MNILLRSNSFAALLIRRRPLVRAMSSAPNSYDRPGPPRLPPAEQAEFEALVRKVEEGTAALHPDAPAPLAPEFEGDVNPTTGERGGPKREPVRRWNEGDWSFKGRVSDF